LESAIQGVHRTPRSSRKPALNRANVASGSADVHGDPPARTFEDPRERLAFARLVTHYWRHACFLDDGQLLRDATRLAGIRGVLVHGRLDLSSPLDVPWQLHRRWPGSDLVVVDEGRHSGGHGMRETLRAATDRVASGPID
jgi:proline iminopeptidase